MEPFGAELSGEIMAENLTQALSHYQASIRSQKEDLQAELHALEAAAMLPEIETVLAAKQDQLHPEISNLKQQIAHLDDEVNVQEKKVDQILNRLRVEVLADCQQWLEKHSTTRIADEFNEALIAFQIIPGHPHPLRSALSPAELWLTRESMEAQAKATCAFLLQRAQVAVAQWQAHENTALVIEITTQKRNLESRLTTILQRFNKHSLLGQPPPLVQSIQAASQRQLRQLQRDFLKPMLNDAQLERNFRLATTVDPLQEFDNLQ